MRSARKILKVSEEMGELWEDPDRDGWKMRRMLTAAILSCDAM
jgi:hypothetical protein